MNRSDSLAHKACHLEQARLFQGLDADELIEIISMAHYRKVARGAFFFLQGGVATLLHVLIHGRVKLTQVTPEGHQVVQDIIGPGDMFGGIAILGTAAYPVSAEAMEDSEALVWDGATMAVLMGRYPQMALNAMELMAQRIQELQDRLREMMTERVERRIARTLLRLVRQAGRKTEAGILIDLPLTRQDVAEMTGTTLYTVSRTLSRWEAQGLITCGRAQVTVRKPHSLVTIAEDLPTGSSSDDAR